jgi:SAM-dependent methyltransferase
MMGTSNWQNISYCIELIRLVKSSKVLDIGVGFGRWGMLCREFLDVWGGKVFRKQWTTQIDGIEIFPENIDKYHSYFYNQVYLGDAYAVIDTLKTRYDLVILGDVLEHFEKEQAMLFMGKCLKRGKYVLLIIPLGTNWQQGAVYGNEHERHLSFWSKEDLHKFPAEHQQMFKDQAGRSFGVYLFHSKEVSL